MEFIHEAKKLTSINLLCRLVVLACVFFGVSCTRKKNMPPNEPLIIAVTHIGEYEEGSIVSLEGYLVNGNCSKYYKKQGGSKGEYLGKSCTAMIQAEKESSDYDSLCGDRALAEMAPQQLALKNTTPYRQKVRVTGIVGGKNPVDPDYNNGCSVSVNYVDDATTGQRLLTIEKREP